jgi:hypothetical protein
MTKLKNIHCCVISYFLFPSFFQLNFSKALIETTAIDEGSGDEVSGDEGYSYVFQNFD